MLPFLKKIFVDDPIARTKKIYFWCYNFIGIRFRFPYTLFYHLYVRRPIQVGKEGRVEMFSLDSGIVRGCNLRCEFCYTFSPYQKGYVPADELIESYLEWRKKVKPKYFVVSGGEPLLHPELPRILRESARIWDDSKLILNTNGLLLDSVKPEVLQAVKETGYELIITEHTFELEHRKKLDTLYARLKKEGFRFVVRPSRLTWLAWHQYDSKGGLIPYRSNPKRAWNSCTLLSCAVISGNKLYKCGRLLDIRNAVEAGIVDAEDWKAALTYQPLTLQSTAEEIVGHLRRQILPACTVCPEKSVMVPARQLPVKEGKKDE